MSYCDTVIAAAQATPPVITSENILSACLQADATNQAGSFTGLMTLFAGLLAVFAAILAFAAAYISARKQVALQEKVYEAKRSAYHTRMFYLAQRLTNELHMDRVWLQEIGETWIVRIAELDREQPTRTHIPAEFNPEKWDEHSLLGSQVAENIISVFETMTVYNKLKEKLQKGAPLTQNHTHTIENNDQEEMLEAAMDAEQAATQLQEVMEESTPVKIDYAEVFALMSKPLARVAADTAQSLFKVWF